MKHFHRLITGSPVNNSPPYSATLARSAFRPHSSEIAGNATRGCAAARRAPRARASKFIICLEPNQSPLQSSSVAAARFGDLEQRLKCLAALTTSVGLLAHMQDHKSGLTL